MFKIQCHNIHKNKCLPWKQGEDAVWEHFGRETGNCLTRTAEHILKWGLESFFPYGTLSKIKVISNSLIKRKGYRHHCCQGRTTGVRLEASYYLVLHNSSVLVYIHLFCTFSLSLFYCLFKHSL